MKIDIYAHVCPEKYKNAVFKLSPPKPLIEKFMAGATTLYDMEKRLHIMERYDHYAQVINVVSGMTIESIAKGRDAAELAKIANDETAALVSKYPDRFLCGIANLPLNDTEAALKELDRAVNKLKLKGIIINTPLYFYNEDEEPPAGGRPMDSEMLIPIYEAMAKYDLPIWVHPNTLWDYRNPDYTSEKEAKYWAWQIFGWPYQDTLAMVRLVFSGILERYPNLKFIIHHAGAMIPFFESRLALLYNCAEKVWHLDLQKQLSKDPIDYFRMFYADTALSGSTAGLMCAYAFFGANHLLFGTDTPYDSEHGDESIRETIRSVDQMDITEVEKKAIYEDNAKRILHL